MHADTLNGAPDRAAINRANAQHSTGPRTDTGKKRSSLNAIRHGLTGHVIVLPEEDLAAYQAHIKRWFDHFQPKGVLEEELVQSIADTKWRLNRVPALEAALSSLGYTEQADQIDTALPEVHTTLTTARAYRDHHRVFVNLGIQEHRLARRFQSDVNQLRQIQAERRREEESTLNRAAKMMEKHENEQDTPYDPTVDGFVFTTPEIAAHHYRQARLHAYVNGTPYPDKPNTNHAQPPNSASLSPKPPQNPDLCV